MIKSEIAPLYSKLLYTPRLLLRPAVMADSEAVFAWSSDPEVTRYLRFQTHNSITHTRKIVKSWISQAKDPYFFHWIVEETVTGTAVGSMGIQIVSFTDNHGEVGYSFSRSAWNKGYATEALKEVLRFGFEEARFNRIQASHSTNNPASGRVMEKAGMVREGGPMKDYYKSSQSGYQDTYLYGITKEAWLLLH
ncbi:MAG TPA: GNAT family N-acetyltransferase [Sphaerochaeta sp.]|jgi:ribosomal-protein-alanine N-acetyltransferase|nr:GNAT family N-acetyltransferase [Sphaerochaeta sp.]HQB53854.1 GNAT family N-acetyltransferase [Sphaerochaeta sp.]